jgi:hypothetical protein
MGRLPMLLIEGTLGVERQIDQDVEFVSVTVAV